MSMKKSKLAVSIEKALQKDSRTQDSGIEVIDDSGVITLKGFASDDAARDAASEIVQQHEGVISVINDLELDLEPNQPVPPSYIAPTSRGVS